ncbi:aminoacetone oxidase family FAD-binding enzyme [Candidatus Stoquefichus massiliensis]|uniref:aminoacetone oxidase family FAD-binding enzyme n=1 Tax=Candidatus Stoquefichus massiliensis TaxID=1470350 RepID=UPI0004812B26|nr:aminoacetone oxidase family FAD-binding enzyme [Candidatus Stoquefichus massiliensis]
MRKIVIVGAGASGVYLSILLKKEMIDCDVIVLEQNSAPLKKLLATGNGRCNLSNQYINKECYQSDHPNLVYDIVRHFDVQEEMNELGLYSYYQGQLLYPKSEQALSVKHVMMQRAEELGVLFFYNQEVISIKEHGTYTLYTQQQTFHADTVIWAMGSEAGKLSGINTSRYDLLYKLNLNVVKPQPSLVQMKTNPIMKQWKGVRVKGTFSLLENHQCIHQEKGELLFTDYGVSGIAVMQLSAFYQSGHQYQLMIDFFDEIDEKKLSEYIELRINKGYNHFYDGLLHTKIASYFEKKPNDVVEQIVKQLKHFSLDIVGLNSFETAQVMKGGLSLKEVNDDLSIKKYPHMYAIGEILNVAGLCGGYNLHFAFASASHVAKAIEREDNVTST